MIKEVKIHMDDKPYSISEYYSGEIFQDDRIMGEFTVEREVWEQLEDNVVVNISYMREDEEFNEEDLIRKIKEKFNENRRR